MSPRRAVLRAAFRLLYGPFARYYDLISSVLFLGEWHRWQMLALSWITGKRVLEIGFGTGWLMTRMIGQGLEVYGVDQSAQMVTITAIRLVRHGLPVRLVRGSALHLPFEEAVFDTIVSTFPAEFIRDERAQSEMARALKPGGRLVVVIAGELTGTTPVRRCIARAYELVLRSTDQVSVWRMPMPSGFTGRWIQADSANGRAAILVAEKP